MIAIDLFCGAGGLTRGLLNSGVDVLLGIDINSDCVHTYQQNNSPARFVTADISNVTAQSIRKAVAGQRGSPLLLAGCAPCQPFSSHRRSDDGAAKQRRLLGEVARLAKELNPDWIFIENVPGLARVKGRSTYVRFKSSLIELGFRYCDGVVDAKSYGVAQTRRRLVLIASRHCQPTLPTPTHGPGRLPYASVRTAIGNLPPIKAGERHPTYPNHIAAEITAPNLERLKHTPTDGGSRSHWPKRLHLTCHKAETAGHEDVYGRMRWDAPAPTLTCRCYSISNGRYGHPNQDRAISLREAACLQSFPSDFVFFGPSQRSLGEQIGNAVPVLLAEAIGRHICTLDAALSQARVKKEDK